MTQTDSSSAMAKLLAKAPSKKLSLDRGDLVEGKVIAITSDEVILDLGIKSEGVVNKRDLSEDKLANLKQGETLRAYVYLPENQSGQVVLTLFESALKGSFLGQDKNKSWQKFIRALEQKGRLNGRVAELNKGGLVVEVDGVRGFLPVSQMSVDKMGDEGLSGLMGKDISVSVIEVDPSNNRLIFSSRRSLSEEEKAELGKVRVSETVSFKVGAVTQIGLLGLLGGVEGFVPVYEASWERVEDLSSLYQVGDEIEAKVVGVDEASGRVNLSIRQLQEDPWEKVASGFQIDDVVKGTVLEFSQEGVKVTLEKIEGPGLSTSTGLSIEGFVPQESIKPGIKFEVGEAANFLVSGLDKRRRVILLAPFLTTTAGLIYK